MIGITLIVGGVTPTSRADDGRAFADKSKFTKIEIPAALGSGPLPSGINPQGTIVGNYTDNSGIGHGFLLSKGVFTTIDVPGSVLGSTNVVGINPRGDIVGFYTETNSNFVGFLLSKDTFSTI